MAQGGKRALIAALAVSAMGLPSVAQQGAGTAGLESSPRPASRPEWMELREMAQFRPQARPVTVAEAKRAPPEAEVRPTEVTQAEDRGGAAFTLVDVPSVTAPIAPPALAAPAAADALALVPALPQRDPLPLVRTVDFDGVDYLVERRRLEAQWLEAEGPLRAEAALEVARFLIAQMLLPEARAYLNAAREEGLLHDPALHSRWRSLGIMADVLAGEGLKDPLPEGWEEASLWAIAAGADGAVAPGAHALTSAVDQLQNHAEPVISALLPALFSAAIARGELQVAEGLLRGAREATRLPEEPVYHLMMGRLAQAYDMPEEAFDYFARAAMGRDLSAQRARIAMADLALERKDPKLLPALRDILVEGVNQWRHDYEALVLRARLAQVAEDLGDIPLALDIMGKIRLDHPGTPEAILAHERGALALAAFAAAIDNEAISLETYLVTLREVEPFYRLDPVWPIARQALARAFTRAGLHVAAASEYSALQIDLSRIDAPTPPEKQIAEIPLGEAEAWTEAYHPSRAKLALSRTGLPRFEDLQPRYNRISLLADAKAVAALPLEGAPAEDLALYAKSARSVGLYEDAHLVHQRMALNHGLQAHPVEALHAVISAHNIGADAQAAGFFAEAQQSQIAQDFPARGDLFAALETPMPALQPLSKEIAGEMLTRSAAAAEAARKLLASPLTGADQTMDATPQALAPEMTQN